MLKEIRKNILSVEDGLIVHQVNCQKVMGAGLAKQLSEKFPQVKKEYLAKGDWKEVYSIIVDIFRDMGIELYCFIYKI